MRWIHQSADHLSCLAEYKGLAAWRNYLAPFHLIHRTWARQLSPSFNEAVIVLTGPGITEINQKAHTPLPGTLETENMNADQGFRRAPAKASDLAVGQIAISAALLLFTATALPAIVGRRRDSGKRGAAHARTSRRQAENGDDAFPSEIPAGIGDPWIIGAPRSVRPDPPRHDVEQPRHGAQRPRYEVNRSQHADDYPSWPGRPGPYALHPDHPSWGGGRTDPRWDSTEAALRQDGYSSWPEPAAPPWRDAERPAANDGSGWRGGGTPVRQESQPVPYRGSHGQSATTGPSQVLPAPVAGTDRPPRAGYAPKGFASQPGYAPGPGSAPQADFVPRHGPVLQQGATGVMERGRPEVDVVPVVNRVQASPGQIWDAGSVELATWIISEANQQATEIRHEARDEAATARAAAKQEAATLVQQAADQAAATLAAAELQAAKIRAEILKLSADLGGVATSFTESLLSPAKPAAKPTADPPAKPTTQPAAGLAAAPLATEPAAKLATKPAARPASAPATRPGVSPRRTKPETRATGKTKNRQVSAARKVTVAFAALSLAGAATGAAELALHGPAFFVFRANGAGASQTGLKEDQGPGQPNAPGAHHNAKVIPDKANPVKPVPKKTEKPK